MPCGRLVGVGPVKRLAVFVLVIGKVGEGWMKHRYLMRDLGGRTQCTVPAPLCRPWLYSSWDRLLLQYDEME
jgi:hypothetical protein